MFLGEMLVRVTPEKEERAGGTVTNNYATILISQFMTSVYHIHMHQKFVIDIML